MSSALVLYSYWRSGAAFRVRIALNLKGLPYELRTVNLLAGEGEQHATAYRKLNPQGLVPTLLDGERVFRQSLAIIEYLDEAYDGECKLLPPVARDRARVRALAKDVRQANQERRERGEKGLWLVTPSGGELNWEIDSLFNVGSRKLAPVVAKLLQIKKLCQKHGGTYELNQYLRKVGVDPDLLLADWDINAVLPYDHILPLGEEGRAKLVQVWNRVRRHLTIQDGQAPSADSVIEEFG